MTVFKCRFSSGYSDQGSAVSNRDTSPPRWRNVVELRFIIRYATDLRGSDAPCRFWRRHSAALGPMRSSDPTGRRTIKVADLLAVSAI